MSKKVYIAAKNCRGSWAPRPPGVQVLDVTSAQAKCSLARRELSPMHVSEESEYEGYACFEHYWQAGKVWEHASHEITRDWWKKQKTPKRRYPGSKGKTVSHAAFPGIEGRLDYVRSRKLVYVPRYEARVKDAKTIRKHRESSTSVVIYDFDGPRDAEGNPECLEVSAELLREKINDTSFPFGHGYIVASLVANIDPREWLA